MSIIPVSAPQIKYELLERNHRRLARSTYVWPMICVTLLIICIATIAVFTGWSRIKSLQPYDDVDFIMFGPRKTSSRDYYEVSTNRARMYSLSTRLCNDSWIEPELNIIEGKVEEVSVFKMVCYYALPDGSDREPLLPSMIDSTLCTHINIAFATVMNGTLQPNKVTDLQLYTQLANLKKLNPDLKVLLSLEWFTSTGEMALVVDSAASRKIFIVEATKLLEKYSLDGLDIDWEFPSWPEEDSNQRHNFMLLLKELHEHVDSMPRKDKLIISVAVAAPAPIIDKAYNIQEMARYIDYINLMAYDYHSYTTYLPLTGPNAPLYRLGSEKGYFTTLNTNWSTLYWMDKGMPANKIVVGFPTYGHSFTLYNENNNGWYAPASGIGSIGNEGFVTYSDTCKFISLDGSIVVFDGESKVPYTYRGKEWISFENEPSIAYKAEFAKWKGYGGVMLFSLNTDDFAGHCDTKTSFPLTRRVKNVIEDDQL